MSEFLERAHPWAATLVQHNWPVMLYSLVALGAAIRAYLSPNRLTILFLYGAILLVLTYEYEKHGLATILGTTSYLFSLEVNPGARAVSQLLLITAVPLVSRLIAFALIVGSIVLRERESRHRPRGNRTAILEL
jgi:hypothetical protein